MALLPESFELQVVTPERLVVREDVDEAQIPAKNGYLGILPGHAPLLSELRVGEISYRRGAAWSYLAVAWGFVEVLPDRVIVLAETAERAEEIDLERATAARRRAEERLARASQDPSIDLNRAQVALERALVRLQVARKGAGATPPGAAPIEHAPAP
ncbi:MAG: F0F1 ATP synthase subunit epsilon [Acidobacteria bacterium]|nr:F0F1 ATP synthase subunit epsilon [Acidobacteriota bacterium]